MDSGETSLFDPHCLASSPSLPVFLRSILTAIASFQKIYSSTNSPLRIFFYRFGGITSRGFNLNDMESKRSINQFALRLKQLISSPSPLHGVPQSTLTVTIEKELQPTSFYRIIETILADTYLSLESFSGKAESIPIEYRSDRSHTFVTWSRYFCGFLYIHKMQQVIILFLSSPFSSLLVGCHDSL